MRNGVWEIGFEFGLALKGRVGGFLCFREAGF